MGVNIGRDQRAATGLEPLSQQAVRAALTPPAAALLREFILLDGVDSTNAELLRRLRAGAGGGLVCVAERQDAGRGRRGRRWVSPAASNIYLSLSGVFPRVDALEGLSLAVGVAVADALESCGLPKLQLKWPNDILHAGAKLGGILIEVDGATSGAYGIEVDNAGPGACGVEVNGATSGAYGVNGTATDACGVVVGVGVNVCMPRAADIDQDWTDAATVLGHAPNRNGLLGAMLNHLLPLVVATFAEGGFTPWRARWQARNAHAGRAVVLRGGAECLAGTVVGVDESGALLLQVGDSLRAVRGGELSLRSTA